MRVFLIRHGETEHNVAGLLAGVTDSLLTNHGLVQARRLGSHLTMKRGLRFSQVFASDLQRAFRTANEICLSQNAQYPDLQVAPIQLTLLREQDFGSFELLPWNRSEDAGQKDPKPTDPRFKPKETQAEMKLRADTFLDDSLLPLLALDPESEQVIAIVSHGLFLSALWRALLLRFKPSAVSLHPQMVPLVSRKTLAYLPAWGNTGCLELLLGELDNLNEKTACPQPNTAHESKEILLNATLRIIAINNKEHLINLRRTGGGVGSSISDDSQKQLDGFLKKRKISNGN